MTLQIALGTLLIVTTMLVAGVALLALETLLGRWQRWFLAPPHLGKLMVLIGGAVLATLAVATASVWLWALTFRALDIFVTLEAAVYFSLVAFTTLGFGDILLPPEWRLLAGMAAMNGLLMIGFQTAFVIEVLRRIRQIQVETRLGRK